jgi:hypothetical protein
MAFYYNDYNKKIAQSLNDMNYKYSKDDTLTNTLTPLRGGSRFRSHNINPAYIQTQTQVGNKFIKAGLKPEYPQLNSMELERFNKGGLNPYRGGKCMRAGSIWDDIGNFLKPVGSAVLDIAAPAVGAFMGGPAGATLAKGAREGLRAVTGVGIRRTKKGGAKTAGVGTYSAGSMSAGCDGNIACAPCMAKAKKIGKGKVAKVAKVASSGNRMDIVKKIMKEKGLPLGAASKFVKDNNLYTKK